MLSSEKTFFRTFLGTAGLQLIGRGLALVTGVIFARLLGPEGYGQYSFILSIVTLLALPAIAGVPQLIVRETARYRIDKEFSLMVGMWRWATRYSLAICGLSITIVLGLIWSGFWSNNVSKLLFLGLFLVPFKAMLPNFGATINGLQRPELAQFPVVILTPLIALLVVAICYINDVKINVTLLLEVQILTHAIAVFLSLFILKRLVNCLSLNARPDYAVKQWYAALLPFTILTVVGTMNNELATVFLGFYGSDEAIGYFKVAMQGITLLALGLQAVNIVSGPKIAGLYKQGKVQETQMLLKQSVKLSFFSSIPFALLLVLFGDTLISLLFGVEYLPAANLLTILCLGQVVNVCMGSVGLVLNMTGNERRTLRAQAITLVVTVFLLLVLIPLFQAVGAAIAVSVGLILWNVIMAVDVYRLTGLKTWIYF